MQQPDPPPALGRRVVLPAAAASLLAAGALRAQPASAITAPQLVADALPKLDGIAQEAMQRTGVPGMAIAVVHQDWAIYLKGFGVRQVGTGEPVDPDTVFPLASMSKSIASTVVAALVGDRLLAWDDRSSGTIPVSRCMMRG